MTVKTMVDYKIIQHGDEVFLEEIKNDKDEIKEKEPETKELILIKAKKGEETQDAEVFITYIKAKDGKKVPNDIQIKELRKDGLIIYQTLETINSISRNVNSQVGLILSYLNVDKKCGYYYETYKIIKSIIYGNYIINELYKNGYIVYQDPESVGNFYYTIYKELAHGELAKEQYLNITQIDKINPYAEKDLTLFSNIVDKIRQKIEIKAIKK
ncbi:MAG: hypothetical protein RXQ77_03790 [Candidatus Nanopusillus sp.]